MCVLYLRAIPVDLLCVHVVIVTCWLVLRHGEAASVMCLFQMFTQGSQVSETGSTQRLIKSKTAHYILVCVFVQHNIMLPLRTFVSLLHVETY